MQNPTALKNLRSKLISPKGLKQLILFAITFFVIFPSVWINLWHVSSHKTFKTAGSGSEFLVPGRLLYSEGHGLFSMGGIPGAVHPAPAGKTNVEHQFEAYRDIMPYEYFIPHKSQMGFQVLPMSLFSMITGIRGDRLLNIFRLFNALLMSLVVYFLARWALRYFGLLAAIMALLSSFLFIWFNALGRNLWFVLWVHYLPLIVMLLLLNREGTGKSYRPVTAGVIFYVALVIKIMMSSFEFATASFIMPLVPLVFYAVYRQWGIKKFLAWTALYGGISLTAVITCIIVLSFQIGAIDGSFQKGLDYVFYSLVKRTSGDPEDFRHIPLIYESLKSSRLDVLAYYLELKAVDFGFLARWLGFKGINLSVRYYHFIILFALASGVAVLLRRKLRDDAESVRLLDGLNLVAWVSILAPLSWFIIFKAHSYIHKGLDMIVWHMPFMFFAMMLVGFTVKSAVSGRRSAVNVQRSAVRDQEQSATVTQNS